MNKINKLSILSLFFAFFTPVLLVVLSLNSEPSTSSCGEEDIFSWIALIFILSPFIALILGFIVFIKRKSANKYFSFLSKIAIFIALIECFFVAMTLSWGSVGPRSRDSGRISDISQISIAMEMYKDDNDGKFLQSEKIPSSIGGYLDVTPKDPCSNSKYYYHWISNINDSQKYCVWACLEGGNFFAASHKGVKKLDKAPTDLNCGEEVIEKKEVKDETADWKIYENPSMSFSIKYNPAEWVWKKYEFPEEDSFANPVLASKALGMQLDYKESYCFIQFIKSTPYNINTGEVPTFEKLIKDNKEGVEKVIEKVIKENININISKEVTEKNIKVDGISAIELSYIVSTKVHRIFIPLSEEGETFQIGYYGYATSNCEDIFYQMLSTFKFLK